MAPVCPIMTQIFSQSPYTFHSTVEWNGDQECNKVRLGMEGMQSCITRNVTRCRATYVFVGQMMLKLELCRLD